MSISREEDHPSVSIEAMNYRLRRLEEDLKLTRDSLDKLAARLDSIKTLLISTLAALLLQLIASIFNRVILPPH